MNVLEQIQTKEACAAAYERRTVVPPSRSLIDVTLTDEQLSSVCYALVFIYNGALKKKMKADDLEESLETDCDFNSTCLEIIVQVYARTLATFAATTRCVCTSCHNMAINPKNEFIRNF